jgi:hypothetical protein
MLVPDIPPEFRTWMTRIVEQDLLDEGVPRNELDLLVPGQLELVIAKLWDAAHGSPILFRLAVRDWCENKTVAYCLRLTGEMERSLRPPSSHLRRGTWDWDRARPPGLGSVGAFIRDKNPGRPSRAERRLMKLLRGNSLEQLEPEYDTTSEPGPTEGEIAARLRRELEVLDGLRSQLKKAGRQRLVADLLAEAVRTTIASRENKVPPWNSRHPKEPTFRAMLIAAGGDPFNAENLRTNVAGRFRQRLEPLLLEIDEDWQGPPLLLQALPTHHRRLAVVVLINWCLPILDPIQHYAIKAFMRFGSTVEATNELRRRTSQRFLTDGDAHAHLRDGCARVRRLMPHIHAWVSELEQFQAHVFGRMCAGDKAGDKAKAIAHETRQTLKKVESAFESAVDGLRARAEGASL